MLDIKLVSEPDEAWDSIEDIMELGPTEKHKIAEAARLGIAWNFAHESAGGEPWAPLAPMTVGIRRSLGFPGEHPILQRTRQLKLSLVDERHPLNIYLESHDHDEIKMEFGTLDKRFPLLHKGGYMGGIIKMGGLPIGVSGGGAYVPARPMTVLGEEALNRLGDTIVYVLQERAKRLP